MIKKIYFGAVLCVLALALLFPLAAEGKASLITLLKKADSLVSFPDTDFSAEYTINQQKAGAGDDITVAAVFRRDKDNKFVILVLQPESDKGKGYLKVDNNLWLYDPISRRFSITSAKDRFQNSNARNSDFTRSNLAGDYKPVSSTQEKLGRFDCTVINLEAVVDSVTYPKMKIWIDSENLVRKYEDYSLSGQLMRTTAIPSYQKLLDKFIPLKIVIVDALLGKTINGKFHGDTTQIGITKPNLGAVPDLVFTQTYLEKVSK